MVFFITFLRALAACLIPCDKFMQMFSRPEGSE